MNQNLNLLSITNQSQFTTIGFSDSFNFSITGDGAGVLYLNIFQPVPEPATVLALAAGRSARAGSSAGDCAACNRPLRALDRPGAG